MIWVSRNFILAGLMTLAVLIFGLGGWMIRTEIKGAVVASGRIEVEKNRQIIQHPDGGIVATIEVIEGQRVIAGETLLTLNTSEIDSELAVIEDQLLETLARRARLEAERDDRRNLETDPLLEARAPQIIASEQNLLDLRLQAETREMEQLTQQVTQITRQIEGLEAQITAQNEQLSLIQEELTAEESLLARGLSESPKVLALRRERAALTGQIAETIAARAVATERQSGIELDMLALSNNRREAAMAELRDLQPRETELREKQRTLLNRISRADIRAPLTGTVYDLQVFGTSAVIRSAEPLMFLIPEDRPIVITAEIPARDIDQVFIDQNATLRFSAFDQRTTPELFGRVLNVSADTFIDQISGAPYYRVELRLETDELGKLNAEQRLIPGMPVEVFLATQPRRPLDYLIKPLADYFNRAFREG